MDWLSKDTFTAAAAGVAAITGLWGWFKSWRHDSVSIKFGSYRTQTFGGLSLRVHNLSPHQILIIDVGFIDRAGKATSLVELEEIVGRDVSYFLGETDLAPRRSCYGSLDDEGRTDIGAFVITSDQWFYRMDFDSTMPLWARLLLRLKWYKRSICHLLA